MTHTSFFLATLGCKVNQYETQALREAWLAAGLTEAPCAESAHIIVVNSCAVTAKAVADVRNTVRKLHRAAPSASILVTGCAAQVLHDELGVLPGVCAVVAQEHKDKLLSFFFGQQVQKVLSGSKSVAERVTSLLERGSNLFLPSEKDAMRILPSSQDFIEEEGALQDTAYPDFSVAGYNRSRAVLKVQDGCSHRCTYCIVPLTRGKARSRVLEESIAEAERLLSAGFREIVISGVNLRQYGHDLTPKHDFWDLIEALESRLACTWQGKMRFRISSLEPGQLNERGIAVLEKSCLVAPHLHLSLQSGSLSVLRRMGRGHYNPEEIVDFVDKIQHIWPMFALGADILTAFPAETDEEYEKTLALCKVLPFSYAHVFPYSQRPGTVAATMAGQLPNAIKKERARELRECIRIKQEAFFEKALRLNELFVAPEVLSSPPDEADDEFSRFSEGVYGISEHYISCKVEGKEALSQDYGLIKVKPFSRDGMVLRVKAL